MEVKAGYKWSEVGVIPEDWEVKPLHALADKIMVGIASAATYAYRKKGIVLFRNQNIKPGYLDDSDILHIAPDYEVAFKNKRLKAGDLLTARTGYPGTTCLVPPEHEGSQSFTTLITRPNERAVNSGYLCCFINSNQGQTYFEQNQIGGGQKNVNAGSLEHLPIPLPPTKAEQEAIAEALSDADALTESLERLISKKRHLKQGAMQELLTGKRRLHGFEGAAMASKQTEVGLIPEDWQRVEIGGSVDLLTGFPFPSSGYSKSGVRLLRGSNVKRGVTDWSVEATEYWPAITSKIRKYALEHGDIVIAMDGSLVGRSFAMLSDSDVPAVLLQRVARMRSSSIDQKFLKAWICSPRFTAHCDAVKTVTAIPHISPADIRSFSVALPPTKAEQTAIAAVLSDMDAEIAALEAKLAKARQIKQGMMHNLLTGRIRLV